MNNFPENNNNENTDINTSSLNQITYSPSDDGSYNCTLSAGGASPKKKNKKSLALMILMIILAVGLLSLGVLLGLNIKFFSSIPNLLNYGNQTSGNGTANIVINRPQLETNPIDYTDRKRLTLPDVAAAVSASVVEIKTEAAVYDDFFRPYVSEGAGSGVIITDSGFIITNYHVISGASSITVKLTSGEEYPATLVGGDKETDIAVISITSRETLTPAYIGKSGSLVIGEQIVVVGNPLGSLGGSVTEGIISALDRIIIIDNEEMNLIQTNAAVNPGNSGGGMFNMYGELVGIINAKSSGENIEGIGFAIPIDDAFNIASQLIEFGYVRGKVSHGLTLIEINDYFDMHKYGVYNLGVYIYSSEYTDELKNGDLIRQINGTTIKSISDIKTALDTSKVGDVVNVTVTRGKTTVTVSLTLKEYVPE